MLEKTLESSLDCRRSSQSILKEIRPEYSLEGLKLKVNPQQFCHLLQRTSSFENTLMLGKIEGRKRRGQQRMRWMTSPTWWTWIWASSGSCWSTGKPGVLQSTGSQRVGHDWVTELNWTEPDINVKLSEIRKQSYAYRIMFAVSWKFQLCNRFFSS